MRILCIGDVVGSVGCRFLRSKLPALKKVKGIDLVVCNGENSADGNGITPVSARFLLDSGVDVITLGNHAYRRREAYELFDESPFIARPANFPEGAAPGRGIVNLDMPEKTSYSSSADKHRFSQGKAEVISMTDHALVRLPLETFGVYPSSL